MSEPCFALKSRRVLTELGVREAAVVVRGEKIDDIVGPLDLGPDIQVVDLGNDVLMAGLVDCHVHLNEPGRTEWEGFETGTRAAAAGGVTTLVDMPLNCIPVTTTARALETKLEASRDKLFVDCGFWGGVVPDNARDLDDLVREGALGAKGFLCPSGIDDFPRVDATDLMRALPALTKAGVPLLVHAEIEGPADVPDLPSRAYRRYLESRPPAWEDVAVAAMIELCRQTGSRVHIVHLSSSSALDMLADARAKGLPITAETCPHYLCLRAEDVPDGATQFKCAPPIREEKNRNALWTGLREGILDFVVSDHSPCIPELKLFERGDFLEAWGGIASLELRLPVFWTEARRHGFGLADVARWLCERPAAFAGLGQSKGRLAPGYDADLCAWNPDRSWRLEPAQILQRHKTTPYLGRVLYGEVTATWLRGRKIAEHRVCIDTPTGRPLLGRHG